MIAPTSIFDHVSRYALIAAKARAVIDAMRAGAVLHMHYEGASARWHLSTGADVHTSIAHVVLDHPDIELQSDALPLAGGASPQTFVIKHKE